MTHTLDFKDLYTSGHWDQVLHHWVMMNIRSEHGEQAFQDRNAGRKRRSVIQKIVSGAQTGADRAGIDAVIEAGIERVIYGR